MESSRLFVSAANFAVIVLQVFVLILEIGRLNEKLGALLSICISLAWFVTNGLCGGRTATTVFGLLLASDLLVTAINVLLLAYFQWVVLQHCVYLNVSSLPQLPESVSCYDWWHFGKYKQRLPPQNNKTA